MVTFRQLCFCFAGVSAGLGSFAQTWDGGAGTGTWGSANNWNPNAVPGNVILFFNGLGANGQYDISLGGNRTAAGLSFISATGVNPFTFQGGGLTLGSGGIVNNDADTQTFDASVNFSLSANQTWNAAAGDLQMDGNVDINGRTLTISGANDVTFSGRILGTGTLIKQGAGNFTFDFIEGNYTGGLNLQQGNVLVTFAGSLPILPNAANLTGGMLTISPTMDLHGFSGAITINGGGMTLSPGRDITGIMRNSGTLTFGVNGGLLNLASPLGAGVSLGSVIVNSAAASPGVIRYGTIAATSGSRGWDSAGRDLNVLSGELSGSGALKFELNNGAMVHYNQANYSGSMNFTGVAGGNAAANNGANNVGRLLLDSVPTYTFSGGLSFDNAMQVTTTGPRTIDANITVNSGEVAFQGRSNGSQNLTLGATVGGRTLTVKDGAAATMDIRFRDEASFLMTGGLTLNANTVLEAGGTLNFRRTVTLPGDSVGTVTVNGDIIGRGTTAKESTVSVALGSGVGGATFTAGAGTAGSDLIVNGSGLGGLRVEGAMANVTNFLTAQRIQDLTGSGGTFTIAYNNAATNSFVTAPTTATGVRLGFDGDDGSNPLYRIGASVNDLNRWGGLVVKGGRVQVMFNESFTGNASLTSLDLLGGQLILNSGTAARTLTFEGGANLTGGILDGGTISGGLVIGGNLTHDTATLINTPNITMNVSGTANISGTSIAGFGTLTKTGAGTVNVQTGISGNQIDIQAGTLLMGGNNQIGDATAIRLSGGALGINGYSDTVGTLTLAANSTIDFGSGNSVWNFANSSLSGWMAGTTLMITNWNGNVNGGGADQLIFGSAMAGLDPNQVSQIRFVNPNGINGIFNAQILANGEIVPVPEPATIGFGALLLGSLGYRERRRLFKLAGFFRSLVAS